MLRDVQHVAHGDSDPMRAAEAAASDADALALLGPFRSREVAEAIEATAPAGLPLLAPVAELQPRIDETGATRRGDSREGVCGVCGNYSDKHRRPPRNLALNHRRGGL